MAETSVRSQNNEYDVHDVGRPPLTLYYSTEDITSPWLLRGLNVNIVFVHVSTDVTPDVT